MNFMASLEFTKLKQTLSDMLTAKVGGLLWEIQSSFRYLGGPPPKQRGRPSRALQRLNQTTRDLYTCISLHPWVACAMRTKGAATRTRALRRVCQCCVDRFSCTVVFVTTVSYGAAKK
jgi:hypothetical protein